MSFFIFLDFKENRHFTFLSFFFYPKNLCYIIFFLVYYYNCTKYKPKNKNLKFKLKFDIILNEIGSFEIIKKLINFFYSIIDFLVERVKRTSLDINIIKNTVLKKISSSVSKEII